MSDGTTREARITITTAMLLAVPAGVGAIVATAPGTGTAVAATDPTKVSDGFAPWPSLHSEGARQ